MGLSRDCWERPFEAKTALRSQKKTVSEKIFECSNNGNSATSNEEKAKGSFSIQNEGRRWKAAEMRQGEVQRAFEEATVSGFNAVKDSLYNIKAIRNCFRRVCLLAVLLALTFPSLQLNWQGTGSMNSTVLSEVNTLITNNPITDVTDVNVADSVAKVISDRLNYLWDPAWNVFIVKQGSSYDSVVYGYAFNNHWMWINGVPVIGDTSKIWAYIIWKDYNCQAWDTVSSLRTKYTTFEGAEPTYLIISQNASADFLPNDVWAFAYNFVKNVETNLPGRGMSVVASQDGQARITGYLCIVSRNYWHASAFKSYQSKGYGTYFIFQNR